MSFESAVKLKSALQWTTVAGMISALVMFVWGMSIGARDRERMELIERSEHLLECHRDGQVPVIVLLPRGDAFFCVDPKELPAAIKAKPMAKQM